MCGITGFVGKTDKNSKKILVNMMERIKHRGPDGRGIYIDKQVALGHVRLSIIDISTGSQPMFNEDKKLVVIFNGEIYNYIELKNKLKKKNHKFTTNSDTEVLLHGYEEWKEDLPKYLRGMFAFAIWDIKNETLFMARDQWGIKPLYYYKNNDKFLFASEIKAFLDNPYFKKELNTDILSAYLCFNSTPTTETFFKGVNRLEPGNILIYKKGNIKIKKYFNLKFSESLKDFEKSVEEIKKSMQNSVDYHQISDVEVGSFLSSGIDSSYIVSLARPNKTYTVGYDDKRYDEISYAKDLTKKLGIKNISKKITKEEYMDNFPNIIYHMDEPLADPSAIALFFAAQIAAKDVKVVLSGEGADELFGGYNSYREEIDQSWYNKIPYFIRFSASKIASLFPEMRGLNFIVRRGQKLENSHIGLGRVFSDKESQKIVKIKNQIKTKDITKPIYDEYKYNSNIVKRQAIDFYFWLIKDFLHAVDRNTMMFSLEARTPFLDLEVYNVAEKLSLNSKVNRNNTKPALREAAKSVIPNNAYNKKKLGFPVPLREWIKDDDVYNKIKKAFNSKISLKLFDNKKIIKLLTDHKNGKKDNYKKVWTIYTFIIWYQKFFEEN